jgi:hypothetical protein
MRPHVGAATHRGGRVREVAGIRRAVSLCVAVLLSATVSVGVAQAAACHMNIVVYDPGDSGLRGQLRKAIFDVCDGGTILLRPGIFVGLEQGELVIPSGKTLTIMTPSQAQSATIDAHGASRVIWVQAGAGLTLRNVIVRGGLDAGLNNEGSLTIANGRVTANTGFGITNTGQVTLMDGAAITENQGSGVFNGINITDDFVGRLILEDNSTINANTGLRGGGIFNAGGAVTLNDNSSVSGNVAATGGGIWTGASEVIDSGLVTLNDSSHISGNEADGEGGGIFNEHGSPPSGNVLNDSSRITHNVAPSGAGIGGRGVIVLNDESTVAANIGSGIANVRGGVFLNDSSSVVDNEGVGVFAFGVGVTLNDQSSIVGNAGAGIRVEDARAILNDSARVSDNDGGGIVASAFVFLNGTSSVSGNTAPDRGGGILIQFGAVVLNDSSTIVGNVARLGGGIYNSNNGEASAVTLNGTSTITANVATNGLGGGIYSEQGSSVTLNGASSITGNIPDNCFPSSDC